MKKWLIAIVVYIGLIAVCCIAIYFVPYLGDKLERTYIAEYGRIDVTDEVSAFIVRDEKVYVAAQASHIKRLAEDGKLVKGNTQVVELTPDEEAIQAEEKAAAESKEKGKSGSDTDKGRYSNIMAELGKDVAETSDGTSRNAGYVSYHVDGAEAKLSTNALDDLTYSDFKELTGRSAIETPKTKCGTGYPVFKIVRNGKWYLVFYLSNEAAEKYYPGDTVTVDFNGQPVTVNVSEVQQGKKTSKIVLSCKSFFDGFFEIRNIDTTVTVESAEGLVLEDTSIVEAPDGKHGVFVKNKLGEHIFKPVKVKADDGRKCVVYSDIYVDEGGNFVETIGTYDEIIANPSDEDIASLQKTNPKEEPQVEPVQPEQPEITEEQPVQPEQPETTEEQAVQPEQPETTEEPAAEPEPTENTEEQPAGNTVPVTGDR